MPGSASLRKVDPDQFGVITKPLTSIPTISISTTQSKDGTAAGIRVVLFDYMKELDHIDHRIYSPKRSPVRLKIPKAVVGAGLLIFRWTKQLSGVMLRPVSPTA